MNAGEAGTARTDANSAPPPSPFSFPLFRAIWIANLASNFGSLIQSVGAAWLMTQLAHSPGMVALVQASTSLPIMLLALLAGAIADNLDRRTVMIAAQGFMLAVSLVLAACAWAGALTPMLLLALTFLIGCGTALNGPAWQASVGDMVPRPVLPAAVAYNSVAFNIARSTGPAVGGAIVAAAGAAAAFLVNAVSYLALILVLLGWRRPKEADALPPERIGSAMGSGVRYVAMSPHLLRVMVRAAAFTIPASAISALMPVVARDLIQGGAVIYGVLLGAFGMGAVGGALLSAPLRRQLAPPRVIAVATLATGAGAAGTAIGGSLVLVLPALALAGGGWILAMSSFNVTVQLASPRWVVGRSIALYQTAAFGGMAVGAWLFGMVAAAWGIRDALLLAAALELAGLPLGLLLRVPDLDDLNLDPLRRWREPRTAVPVEARSGPVTVTLTYRIAESDVPEFLAAMAERRRVRRRDGARGWTLSHDLGDAELWVERYHVPTWLDYVRHNQRRTFADVANHERIMALHRGPEPPDVHRRIQVDPGRTGPAAGAEPETLRPATVDHP